MEVEGVEDQVEHGADPAQVVREFEECIVRLGYGTVSAEHRPTTKDILETWRANAPMKDARTLLRLSEHLIEILGALREGRPRHAEAGICLLLAGMDQAARDGGRWERAGFLTMRADPPVHAYTEAAKLVGGTKEKQALGMMTPFCAPDRATVALAVFKEHRAT